MFSVESKFIRNNNKNLSKQTKSQERKPGKWKKYLYQNKWFITHDIIGGAREMAHWLTALLEDLISASTLCGSQTPLTSRNLTKLPLFQRKHTPSNRQR